MQKLLIILIIAVVLLSAVMKGGKIPITFRCQSDCDINVPGNNKDFSSYSPFKNLCLTDRPIGNPGTQSTFRQWKNREDHWQVEYAPENVNVNLDKVKKSTSTLTDSAATYSPLINAPEDKFFHNPARYCRSKPNHHPCPNSWIKGAEKFPHTLSYHSDNMCEPPHPIPALNEPDFRHRPEFCVKDENFSGNFEL